MPRRTDLPPLRRGGLDPDPIAQFRTWYREAADDVPLRDAMTLATVDPEGFPDARMVLLKGVDAEGFRFYTNYGSIKAHQLGENPRAALVVYWREMDRQVRVRGEVERLAAEESDAYFARRPRGSAIGAWASEQSTVLADRETLQRRIDAIEERFADVDPIPRPDHWGGFLVRPQTIELWQGVPERLHDRFRYTRRPGGGWLLERLSP